MAAGGAGGATIDRALDELTAAVDALSSVDAASLDGDALAEALRRLAKQDGRLDGVQARLVAAAEAAALPERAGAPSTTSWIAETTGRSHHQAGRTSKLASTVAATPQVADAVTDGTLGPDQAATVASAMDRGELEPSDAQDLVRSAAHLPPGAFSRESRRKAGRRRQERLRRQELTAKDERYVQTWRTENGSLRFEGLVPPAEGDRVHKALSAFYEPDGAEVPDDQRRTHRQCMADALTSLVDGALRSGAAGTTGTVLPHIAVLVPIEAMAPLAAAAEAGVTAVTDLDTVLSAAEFHKLACDPVVRRVVVDPQGRPLDVGRATRKWSGAQRAAITAVDGGCRGPACDLPPDRCVIHHITWWRDGGDTSVDNGLLLCGHAHDLIHDHGWTIEMDPATRTVTWTAPDGHEVVTHPRGEGAPGLGAAAQGRDLGPSIRSSATSAPPNRDDEARPRHARTDDLSTAVRDPRSRGDRGPPPQGHRDPPRRGTTSLQLEF